MKQLLFLAAFLPLNMICHDDFSDEDTSKIQILHQATQKLTQKALSLLKSQETVLYMQQLENYIQNMSMETAKKCLERMQAAASFEDKMKIATSLVNENPEFQELYERGKILCDALLKEGKELKREYAEIIPPHQCAVERNALCILQTTFNNAIYNNLIAELTKKAAQNEMMS